MFFKPQSFTILPLNFALVPFSIPVSDILPRHYNYYKWQVFREAVSVQCTAEEESGDQASRWWRRCSDKNYQTSMRLCHTSHTENWDKAVILMLISIVVIIYFLQPFYLYDLTDF